MKRSTALGIWLLIGTAACCQIAEKAGGISVVAEARLYKPGTACIYLVDEASFATPLKGMLISG